MEPNSENIQPHNTKLIVVFIVGIATLAILVVAGMTLFKQFPDKFKFNNTPSLPISLDDKSLRGASILYAFDGRIEKIEEQGSEKKLTLRSVNGVILPVELTVPSKFTINLIDNAGSFTGTASASLLKENDSLYADILYNTKNDILQIGSIRLRR